MRMILFIVGILLKEAACTTYYYNLDHIVAALGKHDITYPIALRVGDEAVFTGLRNPAPGYGWVYRDDYPSYV